MVRRCKYAGCHTLVERPSYYCSRHKQYEAEYLKLISKRSSHKHYNSVVRNRNENKRNQYRFYQTKQWKHVRAFVLERDHYLCQYCQVLGNNTPNSKIVDHITPLEIDSDDRANPENLTTTCKACHNKKTKLEQEIYGTGQGNTHRNVNLRFSVAQWAKLIARKKKDVREAP